MDRTSYLHFAWGFLVMKSTRLTFALTLFWICGCLPGCGGGQSEGGPPQTNQVVVSVTPTTAAVTIGQAIQFSASVSNTTNTAVNWVVNGVSGGNATIGTISATGLYTAPGRV